MGRNGIRLEDRATRIKASSVSLPFARSYECRYGGSHARARHLRPALPRSPEGRGAARRRCPRRGALEAAAAPFKALTDPTRVAVLLSLADGGSCCVCDLVVDRRSRREARLASRAAAQAPRGGALAARRADGDVRAHRARRRAGRRRIASSDGCSREPDRAADGADRAAGACSRRPCRDAPVPRRRDGLRGVREDGRAGRRRRCPASRPPRSRSATARWRSRARRPTRSITGAVARAGYRAQPGRAARDRGRHAVLAARRPRALDRGRGRPAGRRCRRVAGVRAAASSPSRCTCCRWRSAGGRSRAPACVALRRRRLDMNVLMALAAVGAVGIGAYAEGAWVLVLFAVGTGLEAMALERSRRTVASLMDLAPTRARVLADGAEHLVDVESVRVGDADRDPARRADPARRGRRVGRLERRPGADHRASRCRSTSRPGDELFAGTLNTTGALVVAHDVAAGRGLDAVARRVTRRGGAGQPRARGALRRPLRARSTRRSSSSPRCCWRPCRCCSAATPDTWLYRALALLIVACPCSLVISVPVAVVSAVGGAARRGILIKGGQALEDLGRVRAVALDKTGTLTLGLPQLQRVAADRRRAARARARGRRRGRLRAPARRRAAPRGPRARRDGAARPSPSRRCPAAARRRASTAATCGPAGRA